MLVRTGLLATLGFCAVLANAEIYRWVDADGNVHFSDTRPATSPSEHVLVEGPQRHGPLPVAGDARAVQEPAGRIHEEDAAVAESPAQGLDPRSCTQARIDWGILNEGMPVYVTDQGRYRPAWDGDTYQGARRYIPDANREPLILAAEESIFRSCDDPDDMNAVYATYNEWIESEFCEVARVKYERAQQPRSRTPRGELVRIRREMDDQCRR